MAGALFVGERLVEMNSCRWSAPDHQSAIDITLKRFTEYHSLQGAFGRRALIERQKAS